MLRARRLSGLVLAALGLLAGAAPVVAAPSVSRVVAGAAFAAPAAPTASGRVFNGARISIGQVPWQVFVYSGDGPYLDFCGGSIISPTQVVTAAHCVSDVDENGLVGQDPNGDGGLGVIAGISNFQSAAALSYFDWPTTPPPLPASDAEQDTVAASVRIHPGWANDEAGIDRFPSGDVAVITLKTPLSLSGPDARAIELPPVTIPVDGEPIPVGPNVTVAGFGLQSNDGLPNGSLYLLPESVVDSSACGALRADSAVNLCAAAPSGTICSGDSGSGLVTTDSPPVLVGLVSAGPTPCASGDATLFTSLVAPENRLFLAGSGAPPRAPRQTTSVVLGAPYTLRPGDQISCSGGAFTGGAQVKWKITDETGRPVSSGFGTTYAYVLAPGDVGHTLSCRAYASNAGGVAVSDPASTTTPVHPAVTAPVIPPPLSLATTPAALGASKPVVETVTAASSVRRGKLLVVTVTAAPLPVGADTAIVSAPKFGVSARSRTAAYSQTKYPRASDTSARFVFRLRVPKHARTGTRKLPVKLFVYKLGLLQTGISKTITVKIKR